MAARKRQPRRLRHLNAFQRVRIEDAIEAMIAALDAVDPDPDMEPSLGYSLPVRVADVDLEDDAADGPQLDTADDEPELGSFDQMIDQTKSWRQRDVPWVSTRDTELDEADKEPSLGSIEQLVSAASQEYWGFSDRSDRELDPADSGIGDLDGLAEQVGRPYGAISDTE
jgi:hypothetical protein